MARPSSILALVAGYKRDGAGCFEFVVGCVSVVLVFLGGCEFFPPFLLHSPFSFPPLCFLLFPGLSTSQDFPSLSSFLLPSSPGPPGPGLMQLHPIPLLSFWVGSIAVDVSSIVVWPVVPSHRLSPHSRFRGYRSTGRCLFLPMCIL